MEDLIEIRSQAKRNIIVSTLFGLLGLVFASTAFVLLPKTLYLVGIFLTSASIVAFIIAWVKYREPEFSFLISRQKIEYRHRYGQWQISWENIQRIDIPNSSGTQGNPLGMVAIKLKHYPPLLDITSPRLMTNILMEQRPLLLHGASNIEGESCSTGGCYNDDLLENDYYKDTSGKEYKGIQAMFANRMYKLRERLGYDLFVAASELDRPEQDFVNLIKQCQQSAIASRH